MRFYDANTGRFQSEDNVKGFIESPFKLNHYGYCWGNPVGLVDNERRQGARQLAKYSRKAAKIAEDYVNNSWIGRTIPGATLLGTSIEEEICIE